MNTKSRNGNTVTLEQEDGKAKAGPPDKKPTININAGKGPQHFATNQQRERRIEELIEDMKQSMHTAAKEHKASAGLEAEVDREIGAMRTRILQIAKSAKGDRLERDVAYAVKLKINYVAKKADTEQEALKKQQQEVEDKQRLKEEYAQKVEKEQAEQEARDKQEQEQEQEQEQRQREENVQHEENARVEEKARSKEKDEKGEEQEHLILPHPEEKPETKPEPGIKAETETSTATTTAAAIDNRLEAMKAHARVDLTPENPEKAVPPGVHAAIENAVLQEKGAKRLEELRKEMRNPSQPITNQTTTPSPNQTQKAANKNGASVPPAPKSVADADYILREGLKQKRVGEVLTQLNNPRTDAEMQIIRKRISRGGPGQRQKLPLQTRANTPPKSPTIILPSKPGGKINLVLPPIKTLHQDFTTTTTETTDEGREEETTTTQIVQTGGRPAVHGNIRSEAGGEYPSSNASQSSSQGDDGGAGGGGNKRGNKKPHASSHAANIIRGGLGGGKQRLEERAAAAAARPLLLPILIAIGILFFFFVVILAVLGGNEEMNKQKQGQTQLKSNIACDPPQAAIGQTVVCTITVNYPGSADNVVITDNILDGSDFISATQNGVYTGTDPAKRTVVWDAKQLNLPLTNPISLTVAVTIKTTVNDKTVPNTYSINLVGGSAGGSGGGGGAGYIPPSADTCGGKYKFTNSIGKNFGDPSCAFNKDQLYSQLKQADPTNADVWFNKIVPCESGYNPNAYLGPQGGTPDAQGAWGLFQMGSSTPPGSPPPAPGKNGPNDRGDVPWGMQADNATTYGKKISRLGAYWACAR